MHLHFIAAKQIGSAAGAVEKGIPAEEDTGFFVPQANRTLGVTGRMQHGKAVYAVPFFLNIRRFRQRIFFQRLN